MALARLVSAEVRYAPLNSDGVTYGAEVTLAYQQKVTLNKSVEKKELLSNDFVLGESVIEVETKTTYEVSTEIGDVSIENLAIAFRGAVATKTYAVGDTYWNGKVIKANNVAGVVGDVVLDNARLYIVKTAYAAAAFSTAACAPRSYAAVQKMLAPQKLANGIGKIIIDGTNVVTGGAQVLIIPKTNLSFEGDFAVSDTDHVKLSFKGKVLKKEGEELFTLIDA